MKLARHGEESRHGEEAPVVADLRAGRLRACERNNVDTLQSRGEEQPRTNAVDANLHLEEFACSLAVVRGDDRRVDVDKVVVLEIKTQSLSLRRVDSSPLMFSP